MKDEKGHGSNARGGSYPNIERSAFRKGQHVGYGDGTFRIARSGAGYRAVEQRSGESFYGQSLGHISAQLSDRSAAKQLAGGGAKSIVVPVHPGAQGRK